MNAMKRILTYVTVFSLIAVIGCGKKKEEPKPAAKTDAAVQQAGTPAKQQSQIKEKAHTAKPVLSKPVQKTLPKQSAEKEAFDTFMRDVRRGNTEAVKSRIKEGIDINGLDTFGRTALMIAVQRGHGEIINLLLAEKAQVNITDRSGRNALMYALGNPAMVELLISKGADISIAGTTGNALSEAADRGYLESAKILIDKGIDINQKDAFKRTPLIKALKRGNKDIALFLISKGADTTAKDVLGATALSIAEEKGYTDVVRLLKG